jgi:hypothetical protein
LKEKRGRKVLHAARSSSAGGSFGNLNAPIESLGHTAFSLEVIVAG